jgi:hypothetical protein
MAYQAIYTCPVGPTSATGTYTATVTLGCTAFDGVASVVVTPPEVVDWFTIANDSTITYTSNTPIAAGAASVGSVTSGAFEGATVAKVTTVTGGALILAPCAAGLATLSALSGQSTLTLNS